MSSWVEQTRRAFAEIRCMDTVPHLVTGIWHSGSAGASPSQFISSSSLELPSCGIGGVSVSQSHTVIQPTEVGICERRKLHLL